MKAQVRIQTGLRNGISVLQEGFFSPPFKLANITEHGWHNCLQLVLMSASPGMLCGDEYAIKMYVAAQTNLRLHTQAFQRLFHMQKEAHQNVCVEVEQGAGFFFLPHPVVPHAGSHCKMVNDIYLHHRSSLAWGEVLTCGRAKNDEVFALNRFHNLTRIFINGSINIKENVLIEPALFAASTFGQMQTFTHQASLFLISLDIDTVLLRLRFHSLLQIYSGIEAGITTVTNGIHIKMLGNHANVLHDLLITMSLLAFPRAGQDLHQH